MTRRGTWVWGRPWSGSPAGAANTARFNRVPEAFRTAGRLGEVAGASTLDTTFNTCTASHSASRGAAIVRPFELAQDTGVQGRRRGSPHRARTAGERRCV